MTNYDAIVIPGGGLARDGQVPPWVAARLDRALERGGAARYLIPLSAATVHKPAVLDERGQPILEAVAAARYLMARGCDARRILPETMSYDTVGNALFCRLIHTDPLKLRRLLVITSAFHMERTEIVFGWIFGADPPAPPYRLDFEATADVGISAEALAARYARERAGVVQARATAEQYRTLAEIHRFVFTGARYLCAGEVGRTPGRVAGANDRIVLTVISPRAGVRRGVPDPCTAVGRASNRCRAARAVPGACRTRAGLPLCMTRMRSARWMVESRWAMIDGGAAFDHAAERFADAELGFGIDAGGGFVEDEDARVVRQGAGEADELLLAGGEAAAALAHGFLEAVGQSDR